MSDIQIVIFLLNNELCAVEAGCVHKIEKYTALTPIPEMPSYIDGVFDLRGKVVPVINLNRRFGLGDTEITKKTKIIVVNNEATLMGFAVNNVIEIINIDSTQVDRTEPILNINSKHYIKGIGKKDGKLFSIIDLNAVLNKDEFSFITDSISK